MAINEWSTTAASNASGVTGVTWAEGQAPSTVNDSARALMADVATWYGQTSGKIPEYLASVAGTNTVTATGPAAMPAYATGQRFILIPAATNSGATTLNITPSGGAALGAKNVFSNGAACTGGELTIAVPEIVVYDGTQFNIIGKRSSGGVTTTAPRILENIGLAITLSGNAATIALKGADGNDPSASNVVGVGFRNATITTGTASKVSVVAANSTVISSGSTGGTVSALPSRIWVGAILVAGAVELAWFNARGGTAILPTVAPINEGGLITTVAEGGAGGADTAQTWYSTTQRTNVPVTILGYFDSTQTTAGTWAQAITSLVVNPRYRPGDIVQVQVHATGAVSTGTTVIPSDDTIPQNTEGDQYLTKAITPTSASNLLNAKITINLANGTVNTLTAALFQDAVANALAAVSQEARAASNLVCITFAYMFVAALAVSTTLNVRGGGFGAGTTTFNGYSAGRIFGGVMASSLVIEEICA